MMLPPVGSYSFPSNANKVLFPPPLAPAIATTDPAGMCILTPFNAPSADDGDKEEEEGVEASVSDDDVDDDGGDDRDG